MFFVSWEGDLDKDPLDKGVEEFDDFVDANAFMSRMGNKGYHVKYSVSSNSDEPPRGNVFIASGNEDELGDRIAQLSKEARDELIRYLKEKFA